VTVVDLIVIAFVLASIAHGLRAGDVATAVHAYPTYATALQQMTSQMATKIFTSSATGRVVARLFGRTPR